MFEDQNVELVTNWTASAVIELLREQRHSGTTGEWIFIPELRVATGFTHDRQRIDAWAMALWPSSGLTRVAYEVKVRRSDFLDERKRPQKRRHAMLVSNVFYFVAPKGLIAVEEVPVDTGLIEVLPDGYLNTILKAPHRDIAGPPWLFVASALRRAAQDGNVLSTNYLKKE